MDITKFEKETLSVKKVAEILFDSIHWAVVYGPSDRTVGEQMAALVACERLIDRAIEGIVESMDKRAAEAEKGAES